MQVTETLSDGLRRGFAIVVPAADIEGKRSQRLAEISDPKITIDTGGLAPEATELTNRLAGAIGKLDAEDLRALRDELMRRSNKKR